MLDTIDIPNWKTHELREIGAYSRNQGPEGLRRQSADSRFRAMCFVNGYNGHGGPLGRCLQPHFEVSDAGNGVVETEAFQLAAALPRLINLQVRPRL